MKEKDPYKSRKVINSLGLGIVSFLTASTAAPLAALADDGSAGKDPSVTDTETQRSSTADPHTQAAADSLADAGDAVNASQGKVTDNAGSFNHSGSISSNLEGAAGALGNVNGSIGDLDSAQAKADAAVSTYQSIISANAVRDASNKNVVDAGSAAATADKRITSGTSVAQKAATANEAAAQKTYETQQAAAAAQKQAEANAKNAQSALKKAQAAADKAEATLDTAQDSLAILNDQKTRAFEALSAAQSAVDEANNQLATITGGQDAATAKANAEQARKDALVDLAVAEQKANGLSDKVAAAQANKTKEENNFENAQIYANEMQRQADEAAAAEEAAREAHEIANNTLPTLEQQKKDDAAAVVTSKGIWDQKITDQQAAVTALEQAEQATQNAWQAARDAGYSDADYELVLQPAADTALGLETAAQEAEAAVPAAQNAVAEAKAKIENAHSFQLGAYKLVVTVREQALANARTDAAKQRAQAKLDEAKQNYDNAVMRYDDGSIAAANQALQEAQQAATDARAAADDAAAKKALYDAIVTAQGNESDARLVLVGANSDVEAAKAKYDYDVAQAAASEKAYNDAVKDVANKLTAYENAQTAAATAQDAADAAAITDEKIADHNQKLADLQAAIDSADGAYNDAKAALEALKDSGVKESIEATIAAIDDVMAKLKSLQAQADVDAAGYNKLVDEYNQALRTLEDAASAVASYDNELATIKAFVDRANAAAQGAFAYRVATPEAPAAGTGAAAGEAAAPGKAPEAAETTTIGDDLTPLAGSAQTTISDEEVPLASGENNDFDAAPLVGGAAAAAAAAAAGAYFLVGPKRRKKNEE